MDTSLLEFIDQVESTNTYLTEQIATCRQLPQLHTVASRQLDVVCVAIAGLLVQVIA